jgi:hypothetical protein
VIDALLVSCPIAMLLLFRSRRAVVARFDQADGDAGSVIILEEDEAPKFDVRRDVSIAGTEPVVSASSSPDLARSRDYVPSVRFFATMAPRPPKVVRYQGRKPHGSIASNPASFADR